MLKLSFEGNAYPQIFNLVDTVIEWPYPRNKFLFFLRNKGVLVHIPLTDKISRIMFSKRLDNAEKKLSTPNLIAL